MKAIQVDVGPSKCALLICYDGVPLILRLTSRAIHWSRTTKTIGAITTLALGKKTRGSQIVREDDLVFSYSLRLVPDLSLRARIPSIIEGSNENC